MDVTLPGVRNAAFLLAEARGERSRGLFSVPANTPAMPAGTILAADGTQATSAAEAVAILYGATPLSTAIQKAAVIQRDAEVHGELLNWGVGDDDADKTAYAEQLATVGIIIRWTQRPAGLENDSSLPDDLPPAP